MKKSSLVVVIVLLMVTAIYPQRNTSFKMGLPYSTAQTLLGDRNIQGTNFTPTLGLSLFGMSMARDYSGSSEDNSYDMTVLFLIPRAGVRLLGNRYGDLNTYYFTEVFAVIPFISGSDIGSEEKEDFRDEMNPFGLTIGKGVEYFFSDSFSIGGEMSFNLVLHSTSDDWYDDWDNSRYSREVSTRLGATLCQVTFNYYFN